MSGQQQPGSWEAMTNRRKKIFQYLPWLLLADQLKPLAEPWAAGKVTQHKQNIGRGCARTNWPGQAQEFAKTKAVHIGQLGMLSEKVSHPGDS